jgi:hypothetical protein
VAVSPAGTTGTVVAAPAPPEPPLVAVPAQAAMKSSTGARIEAGSHFARIERFMERLSWVLRENSDRQATVAERAKQAVRPARKRSVFVGSGPNCCYAGEARANRNSLRRGGGPCRTLRSTSVCSPGYIAGWWIATRGPTAPESLAGPHRRPAGAWQKRAAVNAGASPS